MLAFQCALRGKLIRHTFDVDSIGSNRGLETSHQHLKMWSDFSDKNYTLSFYIKKENEPGTYLEFPVECFEPNPVPRQNNPEFVRIYFRLEPKSSKLRRTSQGSIPNIPSPGVMKNLQQKLPFSKPRHNSSETASPQSSFMRKFSRNRQTSENSPSQSPPTGRSNNRCRGNLFSLPVKKFYSRNSATSSSGSVDSQLSTDTAIDLMRCATTAEDPIVHPDANEMQHLDIKFTSMTGMYYSLRPLTP